MTSPKDISIKRWVVVIVLIGVSLGLVASFQLESSTGAEERQEWPWLVSGLCFTVGLLVAITGWRDRRSAAWIRLDFFLPTLRPIERGLSPAKSGLTRVLRKITPAFFQSNWPTKKRGPVRRSLRWLGITWVASPLRRVSQTLCLILFCWLFFYVCWPYDARPSPPQAYGLWEFEDFDQEAGVLTFRSATFTNKPSSNQSLTNLATDKVYLSTGSESTRPTDSSSANSDGGTTTTLLGEFTIQSIDSNFAKLKPIGSLSPALLDVITGVATITQWGLLDKPPSKWPSHYADNLATKERTPAELFLVIDPLVSLSTAIASRSWVWSLSCAAAILLVCIFVPRGFCGYLCPLGSTIDLFDWAIAGRFKRWQVPDNGWWVHIKYYLLSTILICSLGGFLISGFFSAIPVITRAFLFLLDPIQLGWLRGWHLVTGWNLGHWLSIFLFFGVLSLGFLRPRFWCKYVCPSGALFSLGNLLRLTERKVESSCIHCNKCVEICPFDAIKPDFTTRTTDCTLCQSCAGVCPTHAIKFVERWNVVEIKLPNDPPTHETSLGRRGFLSLAAGSATALASSATALVVNRTLADNLTEAEAFVPVRPPGSVPEREFLQMCIRCGECFKACPNNVLQPEAFQQGLEGLWTPLVNANWAGCESSCNACGQVCPTGAIRALPIEQKRQVRMGLAIVNSKTCLPIAGREACDLCVQECDAAGYHAIEYSQVNVQLDSDGQPIEGTGLVAPVVLADRCVGCGLCQTRCYGINVKQRGILSASAIIIEAGVGREDRLMPSSTSSRD